MKKSFKFILIALVGIVLASCNMINNSPSFQLSDLQGLWQENGTQQYVRFTTEQSDETGYLYGREWNDAEWDDPDMTYEEYLIWNRDQLGHPGNGWFKYLFETTGNNLTEIHLMDNGGAEIPKVYVVSKLTDTDLVYYEKEYPSIKFNFTKVVTTK
ncbi:MAG: hypothetical protein IJ204_06680 [Paludibacteraceae bacterium]|nr:hypothetical protein [Paludibacteraceae bacterium]